MTEATRDFRQFLKCLTSKVTRLMFRVFIRDPNTWYGHGDPVLGAARVPLVSTPWRLAAIGHLGLHFHGCRAWLCCSQVSEVWNSESTLVVEIVNHFDGSLVSRDHIHLCLQALPPHLENEIISYSAFHDHVSSTRILVWNFGTSSVPQSILRCLRETGGSPSANHPPHHSQILYFIVALTIFLLCSLSSSALCRPCASPDLLTLQYHF